MKLKWLINKFIFIPNAPFYVILSFYFFYKILQNTSLSELMLKDGDILSEDMIEYLDRIYPKHFEYFIAFIFYSSIILHLILQNT